jgi:hypothetical protein
VFLWTSKDKSNGAKCLIAWDTCCQPKSHGGIELRNLKVQNQCLLLKLLHRIHTSGDSSWAPWVHAYIDLVSMQGEVVGAHWTEVRSLLPIYHALTTVVLKDGRSTSIWDDIWSLAGCLQTHTQPYTTLHQPESLGTRHALQWPIPLIGPSPLPSRQRRIVGSRPGARVWRRHEAQPLVDGNNRLQIARLYKAITTSAPSTCNFYQICLGEPCPPPTKSSLVRLAPSPTADQLQVQPPHQSHY